MANTTKWTIDPAHSELMFRVRHLKIANVKGEFREFSAEILSSGDDFNQAVVTAEVKSASIFTNDNNRDTHLKSADFFDAEKYPTLSFKGTSFSKTSDDEFVLTGDLTIKEITKPISLQVEFGGVENDLYGNRKAGFSLEGKLSRKEWELNWNAVLETGGVLVSDEVKISGELQFIKQA
ncbi:MAG: hypothetical protein ABS68_10610 [Niastella sp. SCN 39-18]|nr:YceI family protein [Sphingobacteriales bacterium]ODT52138.1 MAG: hypothetical protein ABS68_10610 [Niastella sp. SCN 39-18]OJW11098.1 MAG: hypothetical protein BGO53_01960 [Sphingobacteriales bacterium 39-19]